LAQDLQGRSVAIKVIRPELSHDPEFRGRFRSEVDRARQVPPFCTAEVIDADPDHPTPYLVVEYVDGPNLEEVVREQGPLASGCCTAWRWGWRPRWRPFTARGSYTET
jgi:serine/threonine protein kinase